MSNPSSPHARPIVITNALRTPIGKFFGSFKDMSCVDLGVSVVTDLLAEAGVSPTEVGSTILGVGRQAGSGPNPARQVSVRAGIPVESPAWTMNMACASGLKTINLAADWISLGRADVMVVGGMESMSNAPNLMPKARSGYRMGHTEVKDSMFLDGLEDAKTGRLMGSFAQDMADQYQMTREAMDGFAIRSLKRAQKAIDAGD